MLLANRLPQQNDSRKCRSHLCVHCRDIAAAQVNYFIGF